MKKILLVMAVTIALSLNACTFTDQSETSNMVDESVSVDPVSYTHLNYTSSLCNTDAIHFFEHWYTTETVKALFVSTDGLFKSFASEEDFLKYHGLLSHMFHDTEKMQKSLKRNFEKRTREGSGDDISIAFVYQEGEEAE